MIRNIIFDVGKVLVSYEPDAYMQRLGISKEKQKKINEAMFQNKLWDTSDQGLGTPDEFLQKFIAGAPELADEITKIHKTVGNTVELFPYAMEWILDLKARGYHASEGHFPEQPGQLDALSHPAAFMCISFPTTVKTCWIRQRIN